MAEKTAIQTALETNASGPASVTNDGVSVTQRSVKDQIEADRYLKAAESARNGKLGFRLSYTRGGTAT